MLRFEAVRCLSESDGGLARSTGPLAADSPPASDCSPANEHCLRRRISPYLQAEHGRRCVSHLPPAWSHPFKPVLQYERFVQHLPRPRLNVWQLLRLSPRDSDIAQAMKCKLQNPCVDIDRVQLERETHLAYVVIDMPSNASISIDLRAAIRTSPGFFDEARQDRARRQTAGRRGASAASCTAKNPVVTISSPRTDKIPRAGAIHTDTCWEELRCTLSSLPSCSVGLTFPQILRRWLSRI